MATALNGLGLLHSLRSGISRPGTRLPSVGQSPLPELLAGHRKTSIGTLSWTKLRDQIGCQKTFLCIFCLDRPQYVVVLTDHSLDALSEMR